MNTVSKSRGKLFNYLARVMAEPPFRLVTKKFLNCFDCSLETTERWELAYSPQYFSGVYHAAKQAAFQGLDSFSVIEFGVATGAGLVRLESYCQTICMSTGMSIKVYGFDTAKGLPTLLDDHRDHKDCWKHGDFPMEVSKLQSRLCPGTELVLGNVAETVETLPDDMPPIGFISFDLDLYSSTVDAIKILSKPDRNVLNRVYLYFDDIDDIFNHRFAGELLAIDEFNNQNTEIKIDRWRGIEKCRPFPESLWLKRMFIAHHLKAIGQVRRKEGPPARIRNSDI